MKFKIALFTSLLLHASIAALVILTPASQKSGEMTYYVDLIGAGPAGGGAPGGAAAGSDKITAPTPAPEPALPTGKMKDLTVQETPKSSFRFPDEKSKAKKEEEKLIAVVRNEPKPTPAVESKPTVLPTDGLSTGISSSGSGTGEGGSGGFGTFFPYAYYVESLKSKISSSWFSSLVTPGLTGKYVATVYFQIHRNGEVSELKIEKSSGIGSIDLSALRAVSNAAPYAPLPADFPYTTLIVHFEFEWEK